MSKKVLVISYNTFPTEEIQSAEGTGLRYWRMACALKNAGTEVDLAVLDINKPDIDEYMGINIKSFSFDYDKLGKLLSGYDVIVFSYGFGRLTREIIDRSPKKALLIADAISPYYVEALTKSKDFVRDSEVLSLYKEQVEYCNYALVNSDYIIVAAEEQKDLYLGIIAGMGLLDEFDTTRMITVPAYPELNHRVTEITNNSKINILWFGGMYPWFNPENLLEIFSFKKIKKLATLTVVGGSNPFYSKKDKRFNGAFDDFKRKSDQLGLTNKTIFFKDWVGYDERINIFNSADLAVSINADNLENKYSFRLRLADMAGNGVPVVTNGGDPLGEDLVRKGLALKFNFLDTDRLVDRFQEFLIANQNDIKKLRVKLASNKVRSDLSSGSAIHEIINTVNNGKKATYLNNNGVIINKLFNLDYENYKIKQEIINLDSENYKIKQEIINIGNTLANAESKNNVLEDSLGRANQTAGKLSEEILLIKHELYIIYRRPWIYAWKLFKNNFNKK